MRSRKVRGCPAGYCRWFRKCNKKAGICMPA
jgi:hypothetical protein